MAAASVGSDGSCRMRHTVAQRQPDTRAVWKLAKSRTHVLFLRLLVSRFRPECRSSPLYPQYLAHVRRFQLLPLPPTPFQASADFRSLALPSIPIHASDPVLQRSPCRSVLRAQQVQERISGIGRVVAGIFRDVEHVGRLARMERTAPRARMQQGQVFEQPNVEVVGAGVGMLAHGLERVGVVQVRE